MTNQMKLKELGGRESGGEESLIELNETVDPAADEDVIELTDVFSAPEGEDGGIIELTQVAAEEETLKLAEEIPEHVSSLENRTEGLEPRESLPAEVSSVSSAAPDAFSVRTSNEAPHENDLLDFGDLDLNDADPQAVSEPGAEALGEPEEALFLEDQEMLDFSEVAGGETQDAALAQTAAETHGLLDIAGFSMPPGETALEGDEFSDIFEDLGADANTAAALVGQPPAVDEREGREEIDREMALLAPEAAESPLEAAGLPVAEAPEKPKSWEMRDGEEKFILGAGGISMRENAKGSAQTVDPAAQVSPAADALMVSPAQVEAAVERVVRRMFSERIETMLLEVLEKAVLKEIQRIKDTLLDGSSENDSR
ncbi:MAG: hypothetical protein R6X05_11090 [Desulfobacterales bacterium]